MIGKENDDESEIEVDTYKNEMYDQLQIKPEYNAKMKDITDIQKMKDDINRKILRDEDFIK